jgi:hypothetical protein
MKTMLLPALILCLAACDDGGDGAGPEAGVLDMAVGAGGAGGGAGAAGGGGGVSTALPPLAGLEVTGDLTYTRLDPGGAHIISDLVDGTLPQRITTEAGVWTHHAVGPDTRFVAAVRHGDSDGDGVDDVDGPRAVWIIDVRGRTAFPISPADCDAGIGGVGWRDEVRVMFSMRCGDDPAAAYLASREDPSRNLANLLKISDHVQAVRDVFPAAGTPLYTYTLDAEACNGAGTCITKPQVWVADADIGVQCRLSDGDLSFTDTSTITGTERRIGDHSPSFNGDLSQIVFSRNVGEKGDGREGHHDLMRVGINRRALFGGEESCAQGGTETNLSESLFDETVIDPDGVLPGSDRFPRGPAGQAPQGTLLYTAQLETPDGLISGVYSINPAGATRSYTAGINAAYGTWIVTQYLLDGER